MGCLKNGLFKYNPQTNGFTRIQCPSHPELPVKTLYNMNQDEIYIGTDGNGMKVYNVQQGQIMESPVNITKVGMTQIFNEDGVLTPVTVLQAGPCRVYLARHQG